MAKTAVFYRLSEEVIKAIEGYATSNSITKSDAVHRLVIAGLATENADLYEQPVARIVTDIMRGELGLFREYQEMVLEADSDQIVHTYKDMQGVINGVLMLLVTMSGRDKDFAFLDEIFQRYRVAGQLTTAGFQYSEALRAAEEILTKGSDEDVESLEALE